MLWPGLALVLTTLAFNLLGDGLRDAFDPARPGTSARRHDLASSRRALTKLSARLVTRRSRVRSYVTGDCAPLPEQPGCIRKGVTMHKKLWLRSLMAIVGAGAARRGDVRRHGEQPRRRRPARTSKGGTLTTSS